jgi:hypothetical protein
MCLKPPFLSNAIENFPAVFGQNHPRRLTIVFGERNLSLDKLEAVRSADPQAGWTDPENAARHKAKESEDHMKRNHRITMSLLLFTLAVSMLVATNTLASFSKTEQAIQRVSPEEAREWVESGQALLVCSYDDDTCKTLLLEGALLRSEFEAGLASTPKDQKIIFYCG